MAISLIMEFNMKEIIFTDPSKGYAIEVRFVVDGLLSLDILVTKS